MNNVLRYSSKFQGALPPSYRRNIKRINIFLIVMLLLLTFVLACGQKEEPASAHQQATAAQKTFVYRCEGGQSFTVEFIDNAEFALFTLNNQTLKLPHALSGSGARYSDGHTTLWIKGDGAFVEVDGKIILKDCRVKK
jgi:membrane-bound inhibitor of C-type lysozyme